MEKVQLTTEKDLERVNSNYRSKLQERFNAIENSLNEGLIDNSIYTVVNGLVAQGNSSSTTSVCVYGVNVFTTITPTNYCTKLPQPVTGKSTKIVNNGTMVLVVYPSNVGGQINNNAINVPAQIPPDGKVYEFICIVNPMPGAWTWTPPATTQFDSGIISCNTSGGTNVMLAVNSSNFYEHTSFIASTGWCYDAQHLPLIQNLGGAGGVCLREASLWNGITKIKVYTNLSATGINATCGLMAAEETMFYDPADLSSAGLVTNGPGASGNFGFPAAGNSGYYFGLTNAIAGTAIPANTLAANIGDAGTAWGELVYAGGQINGFSQIGDIDQGVIANPFVATYPSFPNVHAFYSASWSFGIEPRHALTGLQFQFFIEHF